MMNTQNFFQQLQIILITKKKKTTPKQTVIGPKEGYIFKVPNGNSVQTLYFAMASITVCDSWGKMLIPVVLQLYARN